MLTFFVSLSCGTHKKNINLILANFKKRNMATWFYLNDMGKKTYFERNYKPT